MKKLLLFAILILSSAFICENIQAAVDGDEEEKKKPILITRGETVTHPITTIPRQIIQPEIEAVLYCNSGDIVFTFNENIGEVTISVSDANGNVVASTICNSNQSSTATIAVPMVSGEYTIDIVGAQYVGEGTFEL